MKPEIILYSFKIGKFVINITSDIIVQWAIILILGISVFLLTRNLKEKPNKIQTALENFYEVVNSLVLSTMGESYGRFVPYIGTLMIYLLMLNFTGLVGIEPPTQKLSTAIAFAITSFCVIHVNAIKKNGPIEYLEGYAKPFVLMLPINVMEKIVFPVSLSLRLFGNMLAATIIIDLIYQALGNIGIFAQIGLPVIVHGYFDLFDGTIQMIVFTMLTMIQIKLTAEE
ncbi:MAG TPA: F0F1 ATP synthase subunit A [Clostridium sp.]